MTIRLYFKAGSPAQKLVHQAIPSIYHDQIVEETPVKKTDIPARADFVVHCGKGAPNTKADFFAAQKGTHLTCLPEAMSWFQQKLGVAVSEQESVAIVDALLHKIQRVI